MKKIIKGNDCCCNVSKTETPPDHSSELKRINRIKGQLDGIKKMIEERRYCPDIMTQTSAVRAAVISLEALILEKHLNTCVRAAFKEGSTGATQKIEELVEIFKLGAK